MNDDYARAMPPGAYRILTDEERKYWLSQLPKHTIPAFCTAYEYCEEFQHRPRTKHILAWLDRYLKLSVSSGGRGRDDYVAILRQREDEHEHTDATRLPSAGVRREDRSEKNGKRRGLKHAEALTE